MESWLLITLRSQLIAKSAATVGRVPARCAKPSGRSLEPCSNARPRGMAVLRYVVSGGGLRPTTEQLPSRQNSAYRPGCQLNNNFPRRNSAQRLSRSQLRNFPSRFGFSGSSPQASISSFAFATISAGDCARASGSIVSPRS